MNINEVGQMALTWGDGLGDLGQVDGLEPDAY